MQENTQIRSVNLSLRLLGALSSRPAPPFASSIASLHQLASRIQSANITYAFRRNEREAAREWLLDRGANLSSVQDIAREVRKRQQVQKVKRVEFSLWERLEFEELEALGQEDLLHASEERTAHTAIGLSMQNEKSSHLNNLARELTRAARQEV